MDRLVRLLDSIEKVLDICLQSGQTQEVLEFRSLEDHVHLDLELAWIPNEVYEDNSKLTLTNSP